MANLIDTIKPIVNILQQRPVLAIFEVTLRCNSHCGYCDLPLNQGRYELSLEEIKRVFTGLYRDGIRHVFLQGGEPTLRNDLFEIIRDLHQIGFGLTLVTNGTRLRPKLLDRIQDIPVSISVSLDTLDREQYRLIRGADQLPLVLAGIERLQEYPHAKFITCIVSEQNREDAIEVVRFARERGFTPVVGAYHWEIERYGKADLTLQYKNEEAAQVFEKLLASNDVPAGYFRNYLQDNIHWLRGDGLSRCDAGRYSIAIDSSGNVAPCLALPHRGNLLESSLSELIEAFDRSAIKACSDNSACNMMCSRVIGSSLRHPLAAIRTARSIGAD